jgi:hypothetical protein
MEKMSLKYASLASQSSFANNFAQLGFSLQEKATLHGEVQTLETTLFLEKFSVPLHVGEAADARTPCLHRSMKISRNLGH